MDQDQAKALYPLTYSVRTLFHKLANVAEALHDGSGVTVPMRAVMEALTKGGAQTVPQLARSRSVSRQHIQTLVNELLDVGHVAYETNPAHKKSKLVALTGQGQSIFTAIRTREAEALNQLPLDLPAEDLKAANRVLSRLSTVFDSDDWLTIAHTLSPNRTE